VLMRAITLNTLEEKTLTLKLTTTSYLTRLYR
jgi:hypothetical protein